MKLEKALRSIIDLIIQCCDPDEIVLFGSYAKGNDQPGSDLDILVIGEFMESKYLRVQEMKDLLDQFPIRMDLHLVTPEEIAVESRKPFTFLNSIQSNSISLYKKTV
jgi:predicted nucleotidyltransferase